jgi:hypothetical protein
MPPKALIAIASGLVAGCASLPDVTISYYFPRVETQFNVMQTIACGPQATGKHRTLRAVVTVAASTLPSADLDWIVDGKVRRGTLNYKDLRGRFSDQDMTVNLTADGRLSGVNANSTGEGTTIVKSVVTAVETALVLAAASFTTTTVESDDDKACDVVDYFSAAVAEKPDKTAASVITLTYSAAVRYQTPDDADPKALGLVVNQSTSPQYADQAGVRNNITFVPDPVSAAAYNRLKSVLGQRMWTTLKLSSTGEHLRYLDTASANFAGDDTMRVELPRIAILDLTVVGRVGDLSKESQLWSASVPVPTHRLYPLPIPKPATFGKTAFALGLTDIGAVSSIKYGSSAGGGEAADAFGAIAKSFQPKSDADKAKDLSSQADLIYQQQRVAACQASPSLTNCK